MARFGKKDYLEIVCGDWTYGHPKLKCAPDDNPRKLVIGRYCSIGEGVEIYIGRHGRHNLDTLSTYPIGMAVSSEAFAGGDVRFLHNDMFSAPTEALKNNLNVTIGNDVWIGAQAIIFAGTVIGTGAVIGMRAIVTTDVPPYAIVAGAPSRILRFRYDSSTIIELLDSEWWILDPDEVWRRLGSLIRSTRIADVLSLLKTAPSD